MLNIRPQIYHNIQKIREIHENFLAQLQTISPMSAGPIPEGPLDFLPRSSISKRLSVPGLRGLQNRSLRTRKFKAAFDQHLKALVAEPMECLEVVREIDKLVSHYTQCHTPERVLSLQLYCSRCPFPSTRNFAVTMNFSRRTWPSYAAQSPTG